jgi:subtilisin family serine protease
MARYDHLPLRRIEGQLERRKYGGGRAPQRDAKAHGATIETELLTVTTNQALKPRIADIDPALILKIRISGPVDATEWARVGLTVIASDPDKTLVLFANDAELQEFRRRVTAYQEDPPDGQANPQFSGFVAAIDAVEEIDPSDRIGEVLRAEGVVDLDGIPNERQVLDVELWQVTTDQAPLFTARVAALVTELGGRVVSEYRGHAATLMRIEADGAGIRGVLELPEVLSVDRPPVPDLPDDDAIDVTVDDIDEALPAESESLVVGVIDSGLTSGHPLIEASVRGTFGVPDTLGDDDERGHGTPVSGIVVYGDVRGRIAENEMQAQFGVASAKVVNAEGRFPDDQLVPEQMEIAIRRLQEEFGCRVINISLGDRLRSAGVKPTAWAATLDGLARELDLVIVVSAGNTPRALFDELGDGIVQAYPNYLLNAKNRILEPATAFNVLTVGSIAHANGIVAEDAEYVGVRPIAESGQPSPFSRTGPGVAGVIKPDLVDFGGTAVFDGPVQQVVGGERRAAAGILSLYFRYLERLLTACSGTSYASALTAHKACLLRAAFPDASANLVRALLVLSAEIPEGTRSLLSEWDDDDVARVVGNGQANIEFALSSDDNRVVLYREDQLPIDRFAVYEVPIPQLFQTEAGFREIRVALAFMPPVRHTRYDYLGASMSFRLIRGASAAEVFDHCRKWERKEGDPFKLKTRLDCKMKPGPQKRDRGTLQCATFTARTNITNYGNQYFLVVRCEGGWGSSEIEELDFAVAVELRHEAQIALYQRIEERVRIRA